MITQIKSTVNGDICKIKQGGREKNSASLLKMTEIL